MCHQHTWRCCSHFCLFWSASEISHHVETVLSIEFDSWNQSAFLVNSDFLFWSLCLRKQDFSHSVISRNHLFSVLNPSDSRSDCIYLQLSELMNSLSEGVDNTDLFKIWRTDDCFQSHLSTAQNDDQYHALHNDDDFWQHEFKNDFWTVMNFLNSAEVKTSAEDWG